MTEQSFGRTRKKIIFLFLSKTTNNEARWLERPSWIEAYTYDRTEDSVEVGGCQSAGRTITMEEVGNELTEMLLPDRGREMKAWLEGNTYQPCPNCRSTTVKGLTPPQQLDESYGTTFDRMQSLVETIECLEKEYESLWVELEQVERERDVAIFAYRAIATREGHDSTNEISCR